MGSETIRIPTIDFSHPGLKPGTPEWDSTKNQLRKALEEFGCFEALFDKISLQLRKTLFDALEELFNFPLETKLRIPSKKPFHGYVGQLPMMPFYEGIGIDDPTILEQVERLTDFLWPDTGNPNFCKNVQSYAEQISEFDRMVRRMIVESLGIEKYTYEHIESTDYLLRFIHYTAPQTADTKTGLLPHSDKNLLTILCQNQVQGLEILTKDERYWIDVKFSPESFIIFAGDCLHAWTNGRLHAPHHRVMVSGNEDRYSLGFFSVPKAGYIIKAPEELVDEEHPLQFKPFHHPDLLSFYTNTEAGRTAKSALKTYCGV